MRPEAMVLGAALVAAWLGAAGPRTSDAGTAPRAAAKRGDRLRLHLRATTEGTGVDADATGGIEAALVRRRAGDRQSLAVSFAGLGAGATYRLDAYLGDDPAPVAVTGLTTDASGAFAATFLRDADGGTRPRDQPLPQALDSVARIRRMSVVDSLGRTVLTADLALPQVLRYSLRRPMTSAAPGGTAAGVLRIDADESASVVRVRAKGLPPASACRVTIGEDGDPVTVTASPAGVAKLTRRSDGAAGLFDIGSVSLEDGTTGGVALTAGAGEAGWGLPDGPPPPIPDLVPGTGFTSATAQPGPIGTGPGSDAKAIARWDVVPYQTFTGRFPVGVVAFHIAGIDRVEFSVEGGPWTAVRSMTLNPVTGVWEYNAYLDAATLADGRVEVRAVVYPRVGDPRVLAGPHDESDRSMSSGEHSLFLAADHGGTLPSAVRYVSPSGSDQTGTGSASNPFATIAKAAIDVQQTQGSADGATIYLAAGDHAYPDVPSPLTTTDRWITVCAAPGLSRDEVRITSAQGGRGLDARLVRLKGLTVHGTSVTGAEVNTYRRAWADDCVLEGSGPDDPMRVFSVDEWSGGVWLTDSTIRELRYACYGFVLSRNVLITSIGGDAFREPAGLTANCVVRDQVPLGDTHPDVFQFYDPWPRAKSENVIAYGVEAIRNIDAQTLLVQQYGAIVVENLAFVNYVARTTGIAQWQTPAKHVLIWNCGFLNTPESLAILPGGLAFVDVAGRATEVHDLSIRNSVIQRFLIDITGTEPTLADTTWADGNHYIDGDSYGAAVPGTNATTGGTYATLFRDPDKVDLTPRPDSPLVGRVQTLLVPVDAEGRVRRLPDTIGALILP